MHVSPPSVFQVLDIRNDYSNRNTPSSAPITERDEIRHLQTCMSCLEEKKVELQRRIDDQEMESILIRDEQTRTMESIDRTSSSLKVS